MSNLETLPDRITAMFSGSTVLVTGGTGFLGKVLVEKLLRSATDLRTLYILIRTKRGRDPQERLGDIFNNVLFGPLRESNPEALKKVVAVAGDVSQENLGLSKEDWKRLSEEVEFIYHSAATTRFDDTLKTAVNLNTRGTLHALQFAKECPKLKVFIHVSTAYVCPKEDVLLEKAYPPPANPHDVLNSINWIDDKNEAITKSILGDIPNTYTFSKSLAEALVTEQMDKLPAIIVRPSVVVPIWKEPVPGWCNNLQGPMGILVGAGKGIIRTMYCKNDTYADFFPVDMCINGALVATWDFYDKKQRRFFNLISSKDNALTWEQIIDLGKSVIYERMPFNQVVWYPGGTIKKSRLIHNICFFFYQVIPALFIDLLLTILGYKPVLFNIQMRIKKSSKMFEYYTWKAWNFSNEQLVTAREFMNARERVVYKLDEKGLDLRDYFTDCIHATRKYILKETDDMLPAARRNMKIMWFLDVVVKRLIVVACLYYMLKWLLLPILQSM